ncbi:class I SAM-dependent DNA methyltransferase [Aquabacter sp. P-9]|uniref:class I SAM-dependent DNA methyltransferase n=1 Tax=Aquabacter sediminis TaxID=3029197 RepID=UPI00237DFC05|nr:methyltransferase domain-containing protein [Aquabacter sp. P-9]MDE1568755.1 methyltransferase domain-containing protein [Aquabacter sp. P-9]
MLHSSGHPALDRRLDWARSYAEGGDREAAEGMLADLVEEAPDFLAAWFLLGEVREGLGQTAAAIAAYEAALARDAADPLGAALRLARLGARPAEGAMSADFVRTLFDQYAGRFDTALREKLSYRGPEVLAAAVEAACRRLGRAPAFARALDLGCGTGLAAPLFAPWCTVLEGVDLAPAMVERAERLGLYAALHVGEMVAFLRDQEARSADLVLAADAFCYLGDLADILAAARTALEEEGLLAFTVETHEADGVILRDTLRYAHGRAYVERALAKAGFTPLELAAVSTRTEKSVPVPGLVVVARAA